MDPVHEEVDETSDRFTLSDIWAILRMQKWVVLASLVVCVAIAALWTSMATRYYTAKATVHVTTQRSLEMDMGERIEEGMNIWQRPTYLKTRVAILQSTSVKRKVLQEYEALGYDDGVKADAAGLALLSRAVRYVPRKGTELVDIIVTTTDPELSARLANLMAKTFRDETLASAVDAANDASEWLASQMIEYEEKMRQAAERLRKYQEENDIADVEEQQTSLTARLDSLKVAYGEANTARVQHETAVRMHEEQLRLGNYEELAKSMTDAAVVRLAQSYSEAVAEFASIKAKFGPKWPDYKDAEKRVEIIEQQLRAEIERALDAERATLQLLKDREADLEAAIREGNLELLQVQSLQDEYEKMKLDLENAKEFFRRMRLRDAELELQAKTQLNNVRIVEEARPNRNPTSPNVMQNLMLGVLAGLVLGLGGAFLREWLDDTISSPLDVTTYLKVRLLGIIPKVQKVDAETERSLYTYFHPKSNVAEAIRGIRTVLELSPTGEAPRSVMITSALSGEGKTSTTLRLAIAYASLHRKVVVVDADMRRPRVHKVFDGERVPGLATCLLGQATVDEAVRTTPITNLFYLPAGKAFDRPNELLTSEKVAEVIRDLRARYDMVFIDTPPSLVLSDARLISRHVDAVIVVAKERTSSRLVIREAIRGLQQVGANVLGVVVNAVDFANKKAYTYYGYGYGYSYGGYTYGQDDTDDDDDTESAAK